MIDIYDEIGYIKNILQDGLSEKWIRDTKLLVRYYKSIGMKPKEIKESIKNKCENNHGKFEYNQYKTVGLVKKICDNAYNSKVPLREIRYIDISKEVLDWFLSLEDNYIISNELVEKEKKRRPGIVIKNNKVFNWQRVKFLFTLYIWTKIQATYLDRPDIHYITQIAKRFKNDADLKQSFILDREINFMYDMGFLSVNWSGGVHTIFIDKFDVFKIPITDENRVRIELLKDIKDKDGKILSEEDGDLHRCGYWLEKQKMGSFVCECCGREFANLKKTGRKRKYCKDCEIIRHGGNVKDTKIIYCIDCGEPLEISKRDTKTCRCIKCNEEYIKRYQRLWVLEKRKSENVDLASGETQNP